MPVDDETTVLFRWSAPNVRPIVLLYVTAVFAGFMALSLFVFHSRDAVKALAIGWVGTIAATLPGVATKVEYRLTESGLDKRALNPRNPRPFQNVFRWVELDHVVEMKRGFKYLMTCDETRRLRRFWRTHVSDQLSGEVHVEQDDLGRVLGILQRQRAATSASI